MTGNHGQFAPVWKTSNWYPSLSKNKQANQRKKKTLSFQMGSGNIYFSLASFLGLGRVLLTGVKKRVGLYSGLVSADATVRQWNTAHFPCKNPVFQLHSEGFPSFGRLSAMALGGISIESFCFLMAAHGLECFTLWEPVPLDPWPVLMVGIPKTQKGSSSGYGFTVQVLYTDNYSQFLVDK